MKTLIKFVLQKLLGLNNYLFVFSLFIIATLKRNRKEGDFLHFLSMLPDNSMVLDIGANIGVMTVLIARKLPGSTVFSFEPLPANLNNLNRLVKFFKLGNVKVFATALGNYDGQAQLVLPEQKRVKMQGLTHIEGVEGSENSVGKKYAVPMRKLDNFDELKHIEKPLSGIKLDVENYEYNVLEGATGLITRHRPLVYVELWENRNRTDCFSLFYKLGYQSFVLDRGKLVIFDSDKHHTQNFFFAPVA